MEVVLVGSALSNVAVLLIDVYAKRLRDREDVATTTPPTPPNVDGTSTNDFSSEAAAPSAENVADAEEFPEGSIPALEKRLRELRAEAKQVNSPDTFVQYARLSREANKVEKELMEKKALEPNSGDSTGIPDIMGVMSNLITPHAKTSVKRKARLMAVKTVVRALPFVLLWIYFSRYRGGESAGEVMTIDCRALRPVSFIFRKRTSLCADDDWVCASQPPQCVISYTMVLILANTVFSFLLQMLC